MPVKYRGRFAPSPTGPLHFGSLVAALASFLEARSRQGLWFLRIEDLDPLREPPDATRQILHALDCHGLGWDGAVCYQSQRQPHYREILDRLRWAGFAYRCSCSRRELRENDGRHPHRCRERTSPAHGESPKAPGAAVRFALDDRIWSWIDGIQGPCSVRVQAEIDDFVIQRKEGFFAYQMAVVCDDIAQGITEVVRGHDLLSSTPFQLALYQALENPPPAFHHLPLVTNKRGQKLSKQNRARPLDNGKAAANLYRALRFLGQEPPPELARAPVPAILEWALRNWRSSRIPRCTGMEAP